MATTGPRLIPTPAQPSDDMFSADRTRMSNSARVTEAAFDATRLSAHAPHLPPDETRLSANAPASPQPDEAAYRIGDIIAGQYEVFAIHHGSMGVVYGCIDAKTGLPRALKTLHRRFDSDATMTRLFAEEAALWVKLEKHPFIVRAHEVKRIEGSLVVVTEYIHGHAGMANDLRGWLGHPRLTLPMAVEFALQIAQGMQHAVAKSPGLVHRDLKPANILIESQGRALVTDFGLVFAADGDAGTPAYMAPEQWQSQPADLRSDIYAYGCILYEMLTAHRIFPAERSAEWESAHLTAEPLAPAQHTPTLPAPLNDFVLRCLSKRPEDRPSTWDNVVAFIADWFHRLTGQPVVLDFTAYQLAANELHTAALSFYYLDRPEDSLACHDRAIANDPLFKQPWHNKGVVLASLRRFDEALACYDRALEIDARYTSAWSNKGVALANLQRHADAVSCYDHAIAIDPAFSQAWHNRAVALENLQRHDEALTCYDRATDIDPAFTEAWVRKGNRLLALNRCADALVCYDRAIAIDPKRSQVWVDKGVAFAALGRHEEALACNVHAVEIDPASKLAWSNSGNRLFNLGRHEEALVCYDRAIALDQDLTEAWHGKGVILVNLQRFADAIACYERALEIAGDFDDAWYGKGVALAHLHRNEDALICYDRALAITPKYKDAWHGMGIALANLGRFTDALVCYDYALEIDPDAKESWNDKGVALIGLQRYDRALVCFERAIKIDPNFELALHHRHMTVAKLPESAASPRQIPATTASVPEAHRGGARGMSGIIRWATARAQALVGGDDRK